MDYFMDESNSDIVFIVDGQRIPAVKALLSHKSRVFRAMFSGDFKESKDRKVMVEDLNAEAFKIMIRYIYCDQLVFDGECDYLMAIEVYKCGHKYQLKRLMFCVEEYLIPMINLETFEDFWRFFAIYGMEMFSKTVEKFVEKNLDHFLSKSIDEIKRINSLTDNYLMELIIKRIDIQSKDMKSFNDQVKTFFKTPGRANITIDEIHYQKRKTEEQLFVVTYRPNICKENNFGQTSRFYLP